MGATKAASFAVSCSCGARWDQGFVNKDHVFAEWGRATEALAAAKLLAREGMYPSSVSRAYYAINHAVKAGLAVHDVRVETHEGLKRMFGLHLVRSGELEKNWAVDLRESVDERLDADYDSLVVYSSDHAAIECERAAGFVGRMRAYLLNRGLPEQDLVEVERVALSQGSPAVGHSSENRPRSPVSAGGATEARGSQSQLQEVKPSWKDRVKRAVGIGDTPVVPPKAPSPASGGSDEAQNRGQRRDGPSR